MIDDTKNGAEKYLRDKYGAYRGHHAWRELEEAFNAGSASISQPAPWLTEIEFHEFSLQQVERKATQMVAV